MMSMMPAALLLAVGLVGSLLMFAGDMLPYFTRGAYHAHFACTVATGLVF